MKITDYKIVRETEKALLIEIDKKNYWFPKSKITIEKDCIEMDKLFYETVLKEEIKEALVKVIAEAEDYSEKVFKINLKIKKDAYEAEKFVFIPKSKITELNDEFLIFPKWIWDKSIEEILDKEVEYFNKTYEEQITTNDYEIITEVIDL